MEEIVLMLVGEAMLLVLKALLGPVVTWAIGAVTGAPEAGAPRTVAPGAVAVS
ncbi:MAG: hypothetical protein M0Z87_00055 [Actinomycetota bacterium]|nr:hypothetical protein [Actinomycetota bacterium]